MLSLGIESSCDETAIAIVEDGIKVVCSKVSSQIDIHKKFGGIVPEIAAREHLNNIFPLYENVLFESKLKLKDIDLIGVTQGPGLIGSLLVGASFAKGLAAAAQKPLIKINHVHGHVYSSFLDMSYNMNEIFPAISLVVSGGHTNLYYMPKIDKFNLLGMSLDDACGEAFDKIAKLLNIGYPGGPAVEKLAKFAKNTLNIPVTMKNKDFNFSYSGLKTAVVNIVKSNKNTHQIKADICASFQNEAFSQIIRKIDLSLKKHQNIKSIIIVGGVSANQTFRHIVEKKFNSFKILFPKMEFCSDNGAMIAANAFFLSKNKSDNLWDVFSRYR